MLDGLDLDGDAVALDAEFARRFRAAHAALYGCDMPGRAMELVTLPLKVVGRVATPALATPNGRSSGDKGRRPVCFDATTGWLETRVYDRTGLSAGTRLGGPAVVEEMSATPLLHPSHSAWVDPAGNLVISL